MHCRLLFFGVLVMWLAGCNGHKHPGKKIFRYNESSGIASLDPAFAKNQSIMWAVHQLFNTLVEVDADMNIKPSLAKSWEFSNNNKVLTFKLRDDVFFHDDPVFAGGKGRKITAEDVVYSLGRIIDRSVASPGNWIFNNRVDTVQPFLALDDSTFQIKLERPFQPVLGLLSMQYCSVVAREAIEGYGNETRHHPVGSGPFRFIAWEEGQALILAKNPRYWEKDSTGKSLPFLDGIKVSFYDSKASEFLEFRQGRLDFINDIEASFKDEVLTKTGNLKKEWEGVIELQKHPYLNIEYLGILADTSNPLLATSALRSRKVRQAINYGIDRKKMMLYLRNSIGTAAGSGFIPQGLPSFNAELVPGYNYDPVKSRQLLEEAGYNSNKPIKLLTIPQYANLGAYIANELRQVGINIQVEAVQKSLLLEQTSKSQALFFRGSWIADYPDAENYLSVFYGKNPAPPNYTRYHNKAYDKIYEEALSQTNDTARYQLYRKLDRMIVEDAPVVPLWYDMVIHLVHKNIFRFFPNSLNMLELREVQKE